jgi:hypothetical protein
MRVAVTHSQLVHYITLFGHWEKQKTADLKFPAVTSQLELLRCRRATELILHSTVHRLFKILWNPSVLHLVGQQNGAIINTTQYD